MTIYGLYCNVLYCIQSLTMKTDVRKLIWNANQAKHCESQLKQIYVLGIRKASVLYTNHFKIYIFTTSGNFVTRSLRNRKPGAMFCCVCQRVTVGNKMNIQSRAPNQSIVRICSVNKKQCTLYNIS